MASSDFSPDFLLDFTSSAYTIRYSDRATDRMRSLLFHHLLSQHPVLPTPEGSSRLHFQVLRRFHGLRYWLKSSAPSFPFRANISALQDSLYVAGCCFALLSQEVTTFQHTRSPRCTGCLLPGRLTDLPRVLCGVPGLDFHQQANADFSGHTRRRWAASFFLRCPRRPTPRPDSLWRFRLARPSRR